MAKLDFPDASYSPWVAPNNVIYTYIGTSPNGYWEANTANAATNLTAVFVERTGSTMTGSLKLDNAGSVSLPDISFDGDVNTGLYSPGADSLAITTAGTQRVTVDSSGNVGIGTTLPSAQIEIEGNVSSVTQFSGFQGLRIKNANGAAYGVTADINFVAGTSSNNRGAVIGAEFVSGTNGNDLYFATNSSSVSSNDTPTERMRIDSSGNVGIGDIAPNGNYGTNLSVHSTATNGARVKISDGTTGKGNTDGLDIISTGGAAYFINRENSFMSFTTNSIEGLRIDSSGNVGIGTTAPVNRMVIASTGATPAYLQSVNASSGVGATDGVVMGLGSALDVYYWNYENGSQVWATNAIERMRIDSLGKVLIGTTSQHNANNAVYLSVYGGNADWMCMDIGSTQFGDTGGIYGVRSRATSSNAIAVSSAYDSGTEVNCYFGGGWGGFGRSSNNLRFYTNSSYDNSTGTSGSERMRIDSSGLVGIGTTSPTEILHCEKSAGVIKVSSSSDSKFAALYAGNSSNDSAVLWQNGALRFYNTSERMRLSSTGQLGIGTSAPTHTLHIVGDYFRFTASNAALGTIYIGPETNVNSIYSQDSAGNAEDFRLMIGNLAAMRIYSGGNCIHYRNTTTTGVGLLQCNSDIGGSNRSQWYVLSNGSVENRTGSYTTISSDKRMKKDIVDAPSQWTDIKNIKMRKFRYKADGDDSQLQLGVIAQELELVCPNLVTRKPATAEMSDESGGLIAEGEDILSWKQSIVHLKALKALQEAMERIEQLETKVAALEAG